LDFEKKNNSIVLQSIHSMSRILCRKKVITDMFDVQT